MIRDKQVATFVNELIAEGKLSEEEQRFLNSLLDKEEVHNKFKSGVHARSLTDKERDELKVQKQQQEADYNRRIVELDSLRQTLAATSSVETTKIKNLEAAIADRETRIQNIVKGLKQYKDGGEVIEELGLSNLNFTTPSPAPNPTATVKPETFSKDDILKEVRAMFQPNAQALAKLTFDLATYQEEYKNLTGKTLDAAKFYEKVNEEAAANGGSVDYHAVYMKEYDIDNLRENKKLEGIEAKFKKDYDERLEMELSKRLAPGASPTGTQSEFFNSIASTVPKDDLDLTTPMGVNDKQTLVSEAVLDFQKRKSLAA